jgi:Response regulator containing CheY-like receiver, AAA-type ATPase, and DNA-binding domains
MATPAAAPTETILVVDDDPDVLALAADILRAAGYTVVSTGDPCEALRLARTRAEPLHLLLTDVLMPFMRGSQLAEELRLIRPDVKVLFMSGYWESLEDYRIRLAPGEPCLDKPFTIAKLEATIREALVYRAPPSRAAPGASDALREDAMHPDDLLTELRASRTDVARFVDTVIRDSRPYLVIPSQAMKAWEQREPQTWAKVADWLAAHDVAVLTV